MGETDKAQHDFWRYLEPDCPEEQQEKYGEVINAHYRVADQVLGEILDAFGRDALTAVVSDHGAGPYPRWDFCTNAWLCERGLLTPRSKANRLQKALQTAVWQAKRVLPGRLQAVLRRRGRGRLLNALRSRYTGMHDIDWQRTRAYRVPMQPPAEGIMINLQGRQPKGIVPPAGYEAIVDEIAQGLTTYVDSATGETLVVEAHRRDQIYYGHYAEERAPDLVLVMAPGCKGAWGEHPPIVAPVPAVERERYRGMHSMNGILILSGPTIRRGACLGASSVMDVAPTLLHALGLPVPTDMDGQVLLQAFNPDCATDVRYVEPAAPSHLPRSDLSVGDEHEVVERLRGLGYLE
jgi:predicted AlkP superfamily phosphohydrolase/phosphomutase